MNRCAGTLVVSAWITVTWLGSPELRPEGPRGAAPRPRARHNAMNNALPGRGLS